MDRQCYRGVVQPEQAIGPALVVFGVILIIVLAVARDDVLVGIIIGLPMIIAGAVSFVRARRVRDVAHLAARSSRQHR
jgi:uncharacterized membrane protein HdeD (DUF308 family)